MSGASQPPSAYVTLVSNDGFEFKILREAACIAGTIKKAFDQSCNALPLPSVSPCLLCMILC